jgi:hypothetical protein
MPMTSREIERLVTRIQAEFLEYPSLWLWLNDAAVRFGTDSLTCDAVLTTLVDAHVLCQDADGAFRRHIPSSRLAGPERWTVDDSDGHGRLAAPAHAPTRSP